MERYFLLGFLGSALALGFAALQRRRVLSVSEGNERMQKIAAAIRAGANAYLYSCCFWCWPSPPAGKCSPG